MSAREKAEKATLDMLQAIETDVKQQHPMEFFLYFPDEVSAYTVAAQLFNLQFKVQVHFSDPSEDWLCFAAKNMIPTSDRLVEVSNCLEQLAESHGGIYDGWGTPIMDENDQEME